MAPSSPTRRLPLFALAVCALAVVAAVVAFVKGAWLVGVVWVLMAGLSSNMAWYYVRRGMLERASAEANGVSGE
jgi:Flp pilus assembly protein TadB